MLSLRSLPEEPEPRYAPPGIARITYPCSQVQQRFWFEEQLHPGNPRLNVACRWRIDGELAQSVLEAAWRYLISRHEALRTRLATVDDEPIQIVEPHVPFEIPVIDLRALEQSAAEAEADRLALAEALKPLDLSTAPLLRVTRVVVSDSRSILMVTSHHTICDAWSFGILAREMGQICAAFQAGQIPALAALPLTYGQFAVDQRAWLQANTFDSEIAIVQEKFADFKQFELLTDFPRQPVQTSNSLIASRILDSSLHSFLADFARRSGCTLFMASVAILMTVLQRYSGETTITIGTQVSGRDDDQLEGIVGCFIDTVALHADLSGDPTFATVMDRVSDAVTGAFDLRHYPLERLIETINPKRDLSRNTLFSINFTLYKAYVKDTAYGRITLSDMPSRSAGALYDLSFFMVERPSGLRVSCEYNTDLFEPATVEGIIERFELLLAGIRRNAEQRISQIPLLSAEARQQLAITANTTRAEFPRDRSVTALIADQARRTPAAIAVVCGGKQLTYAELDAAANRLAREFVRLGLGAGKRIGILLERSPNLVISLLAVLKAGSAYVPLDPTYPPERVIYIVENAQLCALVTNATFRPSALTAPLVYVDPVGDARTIAQNSGDPLEVVISPSDLAYLIYTSGSTGKPKGVEIEHHSLTNLLTAMSRTPGMSPSDTLVALTTISFDIAGLELFLPLVNGARLVIADESTVVDPSALIALISSSNATIVQATPATWQMLVEADWRADSRFKMLCGGEALSRKLADALLSRGGQLWNMYGPTETTIWSSVSRVLPAEGNVLIGPPIANTQFYVLDSSGELVPPGAHGELFIGGEGVARGYFQRPDLTRERFVPDPFCGDPGARMYRTGDLVRRRGGDSFEFLGRSDQQVKVRGYRIELGEIEAALQQRGDVRESVAVVRTEQNGDKSLYAFVVPETNATPAGDSWTGTLRSFLTEILPAYMVPSPIIAIEALPRTPNGKIDRNALPHISTASAPSSNDAPATQSEFILGQIIDELLGREGTGRNDDIFSLGFHSLLAVRLVRRIAQAFGTELPLRALFDAPTIRGLALRLGPAQDAEAAAILESPIVRLNPRGSRAPFAFFHNDVFANGMYSRRLAAVMGLQQPIYAMAPHGTSGLALEPTIEAMARDYLPRLKRIQPTGPYRIGGFCAGGLVAYEVARLLREQGDVVEKLVLINASVASNDNVRGAERIIRAIGLNPRLNVRLRETVCYNVARFFEALGEGPRKVIAFFGARIRALITPEGPDPRIGMAEFVPFEKRSGAPETENDFAHLVAAVTFHPQPYRGELTLIWGTDQETTLDNAAIGWKIFADRVTVAPMSGDHLSPLNERIEELARILEEHLA